jgi:hypothetical protein
MSSDFIQKAQEFIPAGGPAELNALLSECVAARTPSALAAVQLLAENMYGGMTYNFLLKAPAAHALVAWGAAGLDALVEMALRTRTTKNISLVFQILAPLAAGHLPGMAGTYLQGDLLSVVQSSVDLGKISGEAEERLNRFLLSFGDDDDAFISLGTSVTSLTMGDSAALKKLISAASLRWMAVGPQVLEEYESLIKHHPDDEAIFHAFFERNPLLLDPLAFRVWSKPDLHGKREPDFVIQRADNSYLVVEIETPGKQLVTREGQIHSATTQAAAQAMDYRSFLLERFPQARATFPEFSAPDALVVVGLERDLSEEQRAVLRRENEHRAHLRIMGFDALGMRASAITQNVVGRRIKVESVRLV